MVETELGESFELLSEAISGLRGAMSLIKRRNSKVSDTVRSRLTDPPHDVYIVFSQIQCPRELRTSSSTKVPPSDTQSELFILRRIHASLRNDSSEASSSPAYSAMSSIAVDSDDDVASRRHRRHSVLIS